ncbi:RVT_3 domain-containing protein [Cephalotus follicularis]|uniref:RVT_3 domain-containing protein n=1 Tax=Cephalotus follicularis TaxID=3775 RepID=A0A1Q3C225_CEPFO|nr:RVT_3 domain-containing protein [Cephalotus follicularis]
MLISLEGDTLKYALKFEFHASNNAAKYESVLVGLKLAKHVGAEDVKVYSDSQLVVIQMNGSYETREPFKAKYLDRVKKVVEQFRSFEIVQIPVESNLHANTLSKLATMGVKDWKNLCSRKS